MSASPTPSTSQLEAALFRWENEDGSCPRRLLAENARPLDIPQSTGTELEHLRVRVIALENLVISLLSQAPERPRALGREMATFISPRPGFTQHTTKPLTIQAAGLRRRSISYGADVSQRVALCLPGSAVLGETWERLRRCQVLRPHQVGFVSHQNRHYITTRRCPMVSAAF